MFRTKNKRANDIVKCHINFMSHTTNEDDLAVEYKAAMTAVLVSRELGAFSKKQYKNISENVHRIYYLQSIFLEIIEGGEELLTRSDIAELLR